MCENSRPLNPDFISEMKTLLGREEGEKLCDALIHTPPSTAVRMNPLKPCEPDFPEGGREVEWCEEGLILPIRPRFTSLPELHAGGFYVQEAASMIHSYIIRQLVSSPSLLLDLCAAPGGKTTAMASALPSGSLSVANEYIPQRSAVLKENIQKWGDPSIIVTNSPAENFGRLEGLFDIVAVDAPCSGEGMMRKDATAREQWTPGLTEHCAALQREILTEAVKALAPGGLLIYSTCTFNRLENEENAGWLATELGLVPVELPMPSPDISPAIDSGIPCMRFFPHKTGSEGLFVCVMRKPENGDSHTFRLPTAGKSKKDRNQRQGILLPWISSDYEYEQLMRGDSVWIIPKSWYPHFMAIDKQAKVICPGLEAAEMKGRDLIPAHAAILSSVYRRGYFPEAELSREDALSFLSRENIVLRGEYPKGIVIPAYGGLPLGRLKNLGNRTNNLYPKNFRILHKYPAPDVQTKGRKSTL